MNRLPIPKRFQWILLSVVILLCVVVAVFMFKNQPITSWDCARMLKIEKEWNALIETADQMPGPGRIEKYGFMKEQLYEMLDDILRKHLSIDDIRRLAATCDSIPIRSVERTDYQNAVLDYMTKTFTEAGDRENLVKLLSTRMLDPLYYLNIEWYLVREGKILQDPITVLGEAYAKTEEPYVRRLIADALRRGFTSLGVEGKSDDEFVKNAMQWYKREKYHVVPNLNGYAVFPADPFDVRDQMFRGNAPPPQYDKHQPLFLKKAE